MPLDQTKLISDLTGILGEKGVLDDSQDLSGYENGARYGTGRARAVVRPSNTEEVSKLLQYCFEQDLPLVAQGANTGLTGASNPDESGEMLVLSLERLRAPLEIDAANRTVTVGAGVTLSQLNTALAEHDLVFPIDLGADPSVGGMIATNTGGARLIKYGDVRRSLMGIEAVLPDANGTILDDLKALRKNNLGLDAKQLFVGTGGRFGVITKAVLEVQPLPRDRAVALVVPRDEAAMDDILIHMEKEAGSWLTSFEGVSRATIEVVLKHRPNLPNPFAQFDSPPDYCLLIELSSTESEGILASSLEDMLAAQIMTLYAEDGTGAVANAVFNRPEEIWGLRHSISEAVAHEGKIIAHDISCPRSELGTFRKAAKEMLARDYPFIRIFDFGHRGDGGDHFNLIWPHDGPDYSKETAEEIRSKVYDIVMTKVNGSFSAEHGIGPINQAYLDKYADPSVRMLDQLLKNHFDPKGLLGR